MKKHTEKHRMNVPICIAFFLLCTTLFSVHLTSGLYARYTVTESGDDLARVIRFARLSLEETGSFDSTGQLVVIPGVPLKHQVKVQLSGSESDVYIFVRVMGKQWKSDGASSYYYPSAGSDKMMEWKMNEGWTKLENTSDVFYQKLKSNENLQSSELIGNDGQINVEQTVTKGNLQKMKDDGLSIKFCAYVVQTNGFDSPFAAWNAVKEKGVNANEEN